MYKYLFGAIVLVSLVLMIFYKPYKDFGWHDKYNIQIKIGDDYYNNVSQLVKFDDGSIGFVYLGYPIMYSGTYQINCLPRENNDNRK